MSTLTVNKGLLVSEVNLPSSKSYANRALILGALSPKSIKLSRLPKSTDVTFLIDCLKEIGLEIDLKNNTAIIKNSFPECESEGKKLHVGEGGTTARFLAALLLRGNRSYELVLGERLAERPWKEFLELVKKFGGEAELQGGSLKLKGPLKLPSEVHIDCSKTTQFASAFQLALAGTHHRVIPEHMTSSQSYWFMTEKIIEELKNKDSYEVPLDWSSASYPLAFAALNQEIHFPGLVLDSFQADSKFLEILKELGAIKSLNPLVIKPGKKHHSFKLNVSDCLDLVPTLGFFLSHIEGRHELKGIENLVFKESDRLNEVMKLLGRFNKKAFIDNDALIIEGSSITIRETQNLILPNDHRMVMVGTLFLRYHGGGTIGPVEAVDKSYPGFFQLLA